METKKVVTLLCSICLMLVLVAVPLFTACAKPAPTPTPTEEPIVLSFVSPWTPAFFQNTIVISEWIDAIEKGTNGRVKIDLYAGGTLLKGPEVWDGLVEGVADMGTAIFAYNKGRFPVMEALNVPPCRYNSPEVSSRVAWDFYQEFKPAELDEVKVMWLHCNGPGDLMMKVPVNTLEDLEGLEIRATGTSAIALDLLGAIPVAMPKSDAYSALDKGIVVGDISNIGSLEDFNIMEVTDYVIITPFIYNAVFYGVINLDAWNSLSPDIQEVIEQANAELMVHMATSWNEDYRRLALRKAIEETGQQVITLSNEEAKKWIERLMPAAETYITEKSAMGLPAKDYLDYISERSDYYNNIYSPITD